jgi:hypothetical protein
MSGFLNSFDQAFLRQRLDRFSEIEFQIGRNNLTIPEGLRRPIGLFDGAGGGGERVRINPNVLQRAASNMMGNAEQRFGIAYQGLNLIKNQGLELHNSKENRRDRFIYSMFGFLDEIGYNGLRSSFTFGNDFRSNHGDVDMNRKLLNRVVDGQLPSDMEGVFASRLGIWNLHDVNFFEDGDRWNGSSFSSTHRVVRNAVSNVVQRMNGMISRFEGLEMHGVEKRHPHRPDSQVEATYISRMNDVSEFAYEAINGHGIREGKEDAVALTLNEITSFLTEAVTNIHTKTIEHANQLRVIAGNNLLLDSAAADVFLHGRRLNFAGQVIQNTPLAPVYRTGLLGFRENIPDVREHQSTYRATILTKNIKDKFPTVNDFINDENAALVGECNQAVFEIDRFLTSLNRMIATEERFDDGYDSFGGLIRTWGPRQNRGSLRGFVPPEIIEDMERARTILMTWADSLHNARGKANNFSQALFHIEPTLKQGIEQTIYPPDAFNQAISMVTAVAQLLCATGREFSQLINEINSQMNGRTIRGFTNELRETTLHIIKIVQGIEDDFGITII